MTFNPKLVIFSIFVFITGVCLTYLTSSTHSSLSNKCVSNQVNIGMNIILMLSVMMMIIPILQLYCHWGCGCPQNDISYKWIIIIISILIISTASVVLNGLTNECDDSSVKNLMIGLISISFIILFIIVILPLVIPSLKNMMGGDESLYSSSMYPIDHIESPKVDNENKESLFD